MDWLESIFYGLIYGLTEFLPVSVQAHEALLLKIFAVSPTPLLHLAVRGAVLVALYQNCAEHIGQMFRERKLIRIPPRSRKRQPDMVKVLDFRFLRTVTIVMILGFFAYPMLAQWRNDLHMIAPVLVVNGLILYIPMHMATGNKDSRSMSQLDALLVGLMGALAVIPGISRMAILVAACIIRGAGREQSVQWTMLLTIPSLLILVGFDCYYLLTDGIGAISIISVVLAAVAAYGGAYSGIRSMQFLAVKAGFSCFAYYSWGAALFALILFLIV